MTERFLRHKSVPVYDNDDAVEDEIDGKRTYDVMEKVESEKYEADFLVDMDGHEFTFERIQRFGMCEPIRIKCKDGLGMTVPDSPNFSVTDIRQLVGSRRMVDVMECKTQRALEMSMRDFEMYFMGTDRKKIYNVISLEISQSRLEGMVQRPKVVDNMDWIDLVWPQHLKQTQVEQSNKMHHMKYPKVQKYCLMSVAGCYTDFHVDFGGTSVWYHILKGGKIFWLIPPTDENLSLYERWTRSGNQGDVFFGDMVSQCQKIELKTGNSFMIPSGWIHAVYTPHDSIVFGGNFLNSFNIPMQLRISQVEERLKVPHQFRFPFFAEVMWFALERYVHCLSKKSFLREDFKEKNLIKTDSEDMKNEGEPQDEDHIHLTPFEYKGLMRLIETLEYGKRDPDSIPDGIVNPEELIEAGKSLLFNHSADDQELAVSGKPKAFWPNLLRSGVAIPKPIKRIKSAGTPSLPKKNGSRVRRVRCKQCTACLRSDCMECVFCRDMKKHGGPGTMKQTCMLRRCLNPLLPSTTREERTPMAVVATPPPPRASSPLVGAGKRGKRRLSSLEATTPIKTIKMEEEMEEEEDLGRPLPRVVLPKISVDDLYKYTVPPAAVTNGDADAKESGLDRATWLKIFSHLDPAELCVCMKVCKNFLKWCGAPKLWKRINLAGKKLTPEALQCMVRRSPTAVNLSETNISYKQMAWLVERMPSLRELRLEKCSWAAVAALSTASCPPLNILDLSWVTGLDDSHIKQLLSTPNDARPGQKISNTRLRFCREISLVGTEVSNSGLKLVGRSLPHLKRINLSFCRITSDGIGHLINTDSMSTLSSITAQYCHLLDDTIFKHLSKLQKISEIDLRGCKKISQPEFLKFRKSCVIKVAMPEDLHIIAL